MEWQRRLLLYTPLVAEASGAWTAYLAAATNVEASDVLDMHKDVLCGPVFDAERTILNTVLIPLFCMRHKDAIHTAAEGVQLLETGIRACKSLLPSISTAHTDVHKAALTDCMNMMGQLLRLMRHYVVLEDTSVALSDAYLSASYALQYGKQIRDIYSYAETDVIAARLFSNGLVLPTWVVMFLDALDWITKRWRVRAATPPLDDPDPVLLLQASPPASTSASGAAVVQAEPARQRGAPLRPAPALRSPAVGVAAQTATRQVLQLQPRLLLQSKPLLQ